MAHALPTQSFDILAGDNSRNVDRSKVHAEIRRIVSDPATALYLIALADELADQMYDRGYSDCTEVA